jgi:hypothetical protein
VDQSNGRMAQLKRRVEPAVRQARAGLPGRILGRLIEVNFLDRTVILAGQAFSALLPLIIVVNTVSPHPGGDTPAATLARRVGLGTKDVSSLQAAQSASSGSSSPSSPRLASPGPCNAATSWPGGSHRPGYEPPGARWPWSSA